MLTFYPSRIPDPGVKKAPDPGSGSATLLLTDRFCVVLSSLSPQGAMNDMNIEKNTTVFSQRFPEECEKHFNLLAKKRFKSGGGGAQEISAIAPASKEETEEGKKARQKKSVLARRLEEKMSANAAGKSEEELLQEVVAELKAKEHKEGGATRGLTSHASFYFFV
jgi:hypothetical protein